MERRKPSNQERRTRKDLLRAANRLLNRGVKPTMDEIADEALVSRATAYRYFSSVDALLAEVPTDSVMQGLEAVFADDPSTDPEIRIDRAEAYVHDVVCRNEAQLRIMLANAITQRMRDDSIPTRQNRRMSLIEAALAPARQRFSDVEYERLCAALALIFGPEAMIVLRDVIDLDTATARSVKSWAVRALVRAALTSSRPEAAK